MKSIVVFYKSTSSPSGKMYLCADGSTSSEINQACQHYEMQFPGIVSELSGIWGNDTIWGFEFVS